MRYCTLTLAVVSMLNMEAVAQVAQSPMQNPAHQHRHLTQIYQPNNPVFYQAYTQITHQPHSVSTPPVNTGYRFNEQHITPEIAYWSLRHIYQELPLIDDPWINQTIFAMTAQMNAQVRTLPLVAVPIINQNDINAFAVPGGVIGINTGTILSSHRLDEVASVLAHEIAHLSQRHYEHSQDNRKKLLALQLGGLLAAIAASSVNGDVAAAIMVGSQTTTAETAAAHSREHEKEADRVGMQILVQAGYDPRAMPRFFERLYHQTLLHQDKGVFIPSFVKSHPFTAERMSEAFLRANQYTPVSQQQQVYDELFDKLTWRLKYLTKQVDFLALSDAAKYSEGAYLAMLMALADMGKAQQAYQAFLSRTFLDSDPLVCITHAHILSQQKQYQQASQILNACHELYPERRDLRIHLAQMLIYADNPTKAQQVLALLTQKNDSDILAWQLTQQAFEAQAHLTSDTAAKTLATIYALHARAQAQSWQNKHQDALQSNAQALQLAKTEYRDETSLHATLDAQKHHILFAKDFKP